MYQVYLNEKKEPMLSKQEEKEFQEATKCYICKKEFEEKNKIREHNHFTGHYRGAACLSCNSKEGKDSKIIPVFFHNGSNYDFHFIIEELKKYEDNYNKVTTLSKSSEEYISIEYGSRYKKLRFLDSYRFFTKGLADIAKSLKEFPILEEEFKDYEIDDKELEKSIKDYISNDKNLNELHRKDNKKYQERKEEIKNDKYFLLKQKGYYPYEYIDSFEKFKEKQLPTIDKWFSTLKQENITKKKN